MQDLPTTLDIVTLIVAIVGAMTGIGSLCWAVANHVLSGGRVKVRLRGGWILPQSSYATVPIKSFRPDATPSGTSSADPMLVVEVANVGRLPVTVMSWSFKVGKAAYGELGQTAYNKRMPHRLDVGEEERWMLPVEDVAAFARLAPSGRKRIRAETRTAAGRRQSRKAISLQAIEAIIPNAPQYSSLQSSSHPQ